MININEVHWYSYLILSMTMVLQIKCKYHVVTSLKGQSCIHLKNSNFVFQLENVFIVLIMSNTNYFWSNLYGVFFGHVNMLQNV